jgi:hypothetical protein
VVMIGRALAEAAGVVTGVEAGTIETLTALGR